MKKRLHIAVVLILVSFSTGCATVSGEARSKYGHLKSAVEASAYAVIGVYGYTIPPDFNTEKFKEAVKGRISKENYATLERYPITVQPKGSYYLLVVLSPDTEEMILFDFSCTPQADGLVYLNPGKYDTNNLDQYDTCKGSK